ncbi:patatin-like phospholipase family protein [Nonomuraea sediminis]|uniref:patatin-like phospholipase family protein n=1 Tax=Nonomuraea sediminis TaxID=2835864 RepID=UPI001BDCABBF|nr:patatin-like phospholipase family protein [Nonomuraea sediminis]
MNALVLGPGGVVGTAWLAGLAVGLRRHGVDLGGADLIVGTSAGAIVGALLATGSDLERLGVSRRPDTSATEGAGENDPAAMGRVFALLGEEGVEPAERLRRVGRLAVEAAAAPEEVHLGRMSALVPAAEWPDRLVITAVDVESGQPVAWDAGSGVPLQAAVAASTAMPGAFPPITIGGRRYMDGALGGGSNAHLAGDAGPLLLIEPLAHLFRQPPPAGAVTVAPDEQTIAVFGADLHNRAAWLPSYQAGLRQAAPAIVRGWPGN